MEAEIQKLADNPELMAKELHTDELDAIIKRLTGLDIEMRYTIRQGRSEALFEAMSATDIVPECGIFAKVLSKCVIDTFGSCLTYTPEGGYKIWFRLALSYKHHDGGSNGMTIATFWFEDGKWIAGHYKGEHEKDAE